MITVGTTVVICKEPPYKEYGVCIGDIGVVTYVATTGKYSVRIEGKQNPHYDADRTYGQNGDFWIPKECVKQYVFQKGDRVLITSHTSRYNGYTATFDHYCNGTGKSKCVELFVDGTDYQPNSRITYYNGQKQIKDSCLRLVETSIHLLSKAKGDNQMAKLTGYDKVVVVEIGTKLYYHALYNEDIVVGDQILVSGSMDKKFFVVKEIISVDVLKDRYNGDITSEVISKVDTSAYDERVHNRIKAAELRKEMDKKISEMDELNKYVMYAEKNPELAKMLNEYLSLV